MYTDIQQALLGSKMTKEHFVNFMRKFVYGLHAEPSYDKDGKLKIRNFDKEECRKEVEESYDYRIDCERKALNKLLSPTVVNSESSKKETYLEYVEDMIKMNNQPYADNEAMNIINPWISQFEELDYIWSSLKKPDVNYTYPIKTYDEFWEDMKRKDLNISNAIEKSIKILEQNKKEHLDKIDNFEKKVSEFLI